LKEAIKVSKPKLKAKGKKYYQNTHGKVYRVKAITKVNKKALLRKQKERIKAQLNAE
jgi:hypothetical protein